jgi:hypothetical protein
LAIPDRIRTIDSCSVQQEGRVLEAWARREEDRWEQSDR